MPTDKLTAKECHLAWCHVKQATENADRLIFETAMETSRQADTVFLVERDTYLLVLLTDHVTVRSEEQQPSQTFS